LSASSASGIPHARSRHAWGDERPGRRAGLLWWVPSRLASRGPGRPAYRDHREGGGATARWCSRPKRRPGRARACAGHPSRKTRNSRQPHDCALVRPMVRRN
jgi:hypothetical protein